MNLYKPEEMAHFFHQQLKRFKYVNFVTPDLFFSLVTLTQFSFLKHLIKGLMVNSCV